MQVSQSCVSAISKIAPAPVFEKRNSQVSRISDDAAVRVQKRRFELRIGVDPAYFPVFKTAEPETWKRRGRVIGGGIVSLVFYSNISCCVIYNKGPQEAITSDRK